MQLQIMLVFPDKFPAKLCFRHPDAHLGTNQQQTRHELQTRASEGRVASSFLFTVLCYVILRTGYSQLIGPIPALTCFIIFFKLV